MVIAQEPVYFLYFAFGHRPSFKQPSASALTISAVEAELE